MDEVYLTADILVEYILDAPEPVSPEEYEEKSEEWRQKYEQARIRHEYAAALIHRIEAGQVTAYLSDMVLFSAIKALEAEPHEEEPIPEDHEAAMQWAAQGRWLPQRIMDTQHLVTLVKLPNVLGIDKQMWQKVFYTYTISDLKRSALPLEVAYHAATVERLNRPEGADIRGIVSFDEAYDTLEDITRIDPETYS